MQISDELLMAYADDELTGPEAESVRQAIASDPALASRVEMFRQTRLLVSQAAAAAPQAQDRALIAAIRAAAADAKTPVSPPKPANMNWRPAAIAASLALAIGAGWWAGLFGDAPQSAHGLDPALIVALENLPSGQVTVLNGDEVVMLASYRAGDGTLCREYDRMGAVQRMAVACNGGDTWYDRFSVELAAADDYVAASGEIDGLSDFLVSIGAGEPLDPETEAEALSVYHTDPA